VKKQLVYLKNNTIKLYKQSNSKFFIISYTITSSIDVKNNLNFLKEKYTDASHICYAYRLFDGFTILNDVNITNFSADAGEPRGSAGSPILNILKKYNIINTAIYVIRYFGGKKLGIPGLIEAYSNSAELIIDNKKLKPWYPLVNVELNYYYNLDGIVKKMINSFNAEIINKKFNQSIFITIQLNHFLLNDFLELFKNQPEIKIKILKN
tara:strand:+ start:911 stop:1537 length:627 start_codon:yes stop_codon:yes gene_type:complete